MMKAIPKTLRGLQFKELVTIAGLDRPMVVEAIAEILKVKPRIIKATMALPAFEEAVERERRIRRTLKAAGSKVGKGVAPGL